MEHMVFPDVGEPSRSRSGQWAGTEVDKRKGNIMRRLSLRKIGGWLEREEEGNMKSERPHSSEQHASRLSEPSDRRSSRKVIPGLPRPLTFKRTSEERRDELRKVQRPYRERKEAHTKAFGQEAPLLKDTFATTTRERDASVEENRRPEELQEELEAKWILNLNTHFQDMSDREKFFITYAEEPKKWRRVTISCDYRNPTPYSLEADLMSLYSKQDRSAKIYEALRDSLPDIQFYETVTNLKLRTEDDGRLHVHVNEDFDEIISNPPISTANPFRRGSPETIEEAKASPSHPAFGWNPSPHNESLVFEIPSVLAGRHVTNALGDSGAKWNFMKEDFAKRAGFSIDRGIKKDIKIGSGKTITTTGTIQATFQFKGENEEYPLIFHLLPKCIHDVILGNPFLKATKTFTSNFRRVKERLLKGISHRHLLYLGNLGPRFSGLVNGIPQEALADSGAKVMVMDEEYALRMGLPIIDDDKHRTRLRFADNSTVYTSGMVYGVEWEFGPGGIGEKYKLDFHILKNAPADVILNDGFLFGTDAFSKYDCYLTDENDEDEEAYFFVISIDMRHKNKG